MKSKKRDIIVYNALFSVHTNALIQLDSILLKRDNKKTGILFPICFFIKDCDFFTRGIICMNV